MGFDIKEIITAAMILFAVIDIIGNIPIIIDLRQKVGHIQSEKASIIEVNSESFIVRDSTSTACNPPKDFFKLFTSINLFDI